MKHDNKILCRYTITENTDSSDFIDICTEHLNGLKTTIKKKIISSALELLQNNRIYNNKNEAIILVTETTFYYVVEVKQYMETEILEDVSRCLNNINEIKLNDLQTIYNKNLSKTSSTTGNGHILCRIKSGHLIDYYISDSNMFIIKLNFNKL
ncbi:MAG: DUF6272 family protein [Bacteroidales bacterium]|nr:DUF6272 family protein [Bacteroidales bacterium]